ncbi:hypothetical protein [Microbacterium sp. E-13]|uniref:hypothetical protein n=1 Tax=Microbacterium sp. E-13 TaxID=3404048 RepID=UPI003CFABC61
MTQRIEILYGDDTFYVVGRDIGAVRAEIADACEDGGRWISVLADGGRSTALLMISPRTRITLTALPDS